MKTKLQVLGVCAGNGASLYPFYKLPKYYNVVANIEPRAIFYTLKNEQWASNYPGIRISRNFLGVQNVDIIIGHPDCGSYSVLTKSTKKDKPVENKDSESLIMYLNAIKLLRPKMFLMENLPGLLNGHSKEWFQKEYPDYSFKFIEGSVSIFGNSQVSRERLVIVGINKKLGKWKFKFSDEKPKTVNELIGDLVGTEDVLKGQVAEPLDKEVSLWWDGEKVTLKKAQELWNGPLKDSKTWPGYYNCVTQPGVYKLVGDLPPKTARKQDRQFNPSGLPLTPREMARIQGIPDDFIIYVEDGPKVEYWVNKGRACVTKCPPYEIFTWFHKMIKKNYLLKGKTKGSKEGTKKSKK